MQIDAKDVNDYLTKVPEKRQAALKQLRELCAEVLDGYSEGMLYGMPSYKQGENEPEVAFASQKNYISLYILKQDVLDRYREQLDKPGISLGKGCIRYSKPEKIEFDIVRSMLADSVHSDGEIC